MLAGVAACGGEMDTGANANTLQRGLPSDPETLDHHKARSTQAAEVLRDLGEGLAGFTANGELVPAAADSWDISEDGLTYTFRLRDGLRWSNGEALTAEHFVAGMRRLVTPATAAFYAQMIVDIENAASIVAGDAAPDALGVEAVDDRTLVLRLSRPTPYMLSLLTHPSTFPVHPGSIAEHGDAFARPGKLVSNGAYRLDALARGNWYRMVPTGWTPGCPGRSLRSSATSITGTTARRPSMRSIIMSLCRTMRS
jgi:oligopeptide transport system substrate-binding protein